MTGVAHHLSYTLLLLTILFSPPALLAAQLDLSGQTPEVSLNSSVEYLEDPSADLTLDQILRTDRQWLEQQDDSFNQGYSDSAWWIRLQIHNPQPVPASRMLELSYAILDYVDIFVVSDGRVLESYQTGDKRPFDTRPMRHRFYVLPLSWQPQQTLDIYFRLKTSSSVQAPLTLWQPDAFHEHEARSMLFQGLYYGAMAIIVVYNLLIFFVLWDRSYLYYVGFVASGPLFFLALSGQGYRYLWTDQVWWNGQSVAVFVSCLVLFGALFTRHFIGLKRVSIALDRLILSFVVMGAVMLGLSFLLPYKITIMLLVPLAILACLSDLVAGSVSWYRGIKSARFYVVAWACFLLGTIVMALQKVSVLPSNAWTEYAVQFGSALEAVLLSFAMAERISSERRLRIEAQQETINTTLQLNQKLEQRVQERTSELADLNDQLKHLSNTDELTGLHNRRFLEEAGKSEWDRCARYSHELAVMILDVDFFKQINDQNGHQAGDQCLRQIGACLQSAVRCSADIVARYGGEEFCLLLPETDREGAMTVAERIRHDIEQSTVPFGNDELRVTVSIGLHIAQPQGGGSLEQALKAADQGLYLAKEQGRNRVVAVRSSTVH